MQAWNFLAEICAVEARLAAATRGAPKSDLTLPRVAVRGQRVGCGRNKTPHRKKAFGLFSEQISPTGLRERGDAIQNQPGYHIAERFGPLSGLVKTTFWISAG